MDTELPASRAAAEVLRTCPYLGLSAHQRAPRRQTAVVPGGSADQRRPQEQTATHHTDSVSARRRSRGTARLVWRPLRTSDVVPKSARESPSAHTDSG